MKLFCWIIGKSSSPFAVDLGNDDTVYDLKEAVMMKKPITLAGLEADQLTVWKVSDFFQHRLFDALVTPYKVSIEVTKDLENEVSEYPLVDKDIPLASDKLSVCFPNPLQGYLHVVVQTPSVGEYSGHR
jgi:hypothetical protein